MTRRFVREYIGSDVPIEADRRIAREVAGFEDEDERRAAMEWALVQARADARSPAEPSSGPDRSAGPGVPPVGVGPPADGRRGDWLCTTTGVAFYPLDPRPEEIRMVDIGHALSNLCRFTGHCCRFYSVAEHSVRVARLVRSWEIADDPDQGLTRKVALAALLHDAAEAYVADVSRPLKPHLVGYRAIETNLQTAIFRRFGVLDAYELACVRIKEADTVLLATEKRDLMPPKSASWGPLPEPLPDRIAAWPPELAEAEFLARFEEALFEAHGTEAGRYR